jgi:hypothetical protein
MVTIEWALWLLKLVGVELKAEEKNKEELAGEEFWSRTRASPFVRTSGVEPRPEGHFRKRPPK